MLGMNIRRNRLRRQLGALVLDVPRTSSRLVRKGDWVRITNRSQIVDTREPPLSVRCPGLQTSNLHVCDVFPSFGRAILRAALREWTFEFASEVRFSDTPEFSFVIPHRGSERDAHLHAVIRSIASLKVPVECIVVEQDNEARLSGLPGNTRYLHVPGADGDTAWNKCLALNAGAAAARGRILVFHDGDILVPDGYGRELVRLFDEAAMEVAFPQRFLFYLRESFTSRLLEHGDSKALCQAVPERVNQNWVGGTVAIRRDAFERIGGYDTRFTGWAGEDLEFFDRCQLLRGWFHGYIPFVHLWHAPQAGKLDATARGRGDAFVEKLLSEPRQQRADRLRAGREAA